MESIGRIIGKLSKDLGSGLEGGIKLNAIRKRWDQLVGEIIGSHSYPEDIRGEVIILTVETPQWMHHLSFFKEEIVQRLETFGIKRVRFRIGRLHLPPEPADKIKEHPLSEEDRRYMNDLLSHINDDELREGFRRLIMHSLTRGKRPD